MARVPIAIVRESLVRAYEAMLGRRRVIHLAWPSEYPLTVCGSIATKTTHLSVPSRRPSPRGPALPDCAACLEALSGGLKLERTNPHNAA